LSNVLHDLTKTKDHFCNGLYAIKIYKVPAKPKCRVQRLRFLF